MLLVDALRTKQRPHKLTCPKWCMLFFDVDTDDLHDFAEQLRIPRRQFRPHIGLEHYELTPEERARAVEAGAVAVNLREWLLSHGMERWL